MLHGETLGRVPVSDLVIPRIAACSTPAAIISNRTLHLVYNTIAHFPFIFRTFYGFTGNLFLHGYPLVVPEVHRTADPCRRRRHRDLCASYNLHVRFIPARGREDGCLADPAWSLSTSPAQYRHRASPVRAVAGPVVPAIPP